MADTNYAYNYPGVDWPALVTAAPNGTVLTVAIEQNAAITIPLRDIIMTGDGVCNIWFTDALPAPDEAALDAIRATHTGVGVVASLTGTVKVPAGAVIEDITWQTLEGIITTPGFFINYDPAQLPSLFARTIGEIKGDGGEFRVVEEVDGEADVVVVQQALPDTLGVWEKFKIDTTTPPRMGIRNTYRVEMRLNGAANLDQKYSAVSMVHARVIM